jgi:hypothetical protein
MDQHVAIVTAVAYGMAFGALDIRRESVAAYAAPALFRILTE